MTNIETLAALIQEVLNDPPVTECAENGTHCVFCYQEWSQVRVHMGGLGIVHSADCWLNRASAAIAKAGGVQ